MTKKARAGAAAVVLALGVFLLPGCGSSLVDVEDIVGVNGTYEATALVYNNSPVLESMQITLAVDPEDPRDDGGITSGTLETTDGPAGPTTVELAGTWTVDDERRAVNFSFDASDELLSDLEQLDFAVQRRRLEGEGQVGDDRYLVVLQQP